MDLIMIKNTNQGGIYLHVQDQLNTWQVWNTIGFLKMHLKGCLRQYSSLAQTKDSLRAVSEVSQQQTQDHKK